MAASFTKRKVYLLQSPSVSWDHSIVSMKLFNQSRNRERNAMHRRTEGQHSTICSSGCVSLMIMYPRLIASPGVCLNLRKRMFYPDMTLVKRPVVHGRKITFLWSIGSIPWLILHVRLFIRYGSAWSFIFLDTYTTYCRYKLIWINVNVHRLWANFRIRTTIHEMIFCS